MTSARKKIGIALATLASLFVLLLFVVLDSARILGPEIPGITHSFHIESWPVGRAPIMGPDSTAFAFAVESKDDRPAILLNCWPLTPGAPMVVSHTFEVYVVDLARRHMPRRILRWDHKGDEASSLWFWDRNGIVVRRGSRPGQAAVRVDPRTGRVEELDPASQPELLRADRGLRVLGTPEMYRHAEQEAGQYFLWDPRMYHREWLFDLPYAHDGHPENAETVQIMREARWGNQFRDSLLRLAWVHARVDGDSLRVTVLASPYRAGPRRRYYELVFDVDVPDGEAWRRGQWADRSVRLDSLVVNCPPDTIRIARAYALAPLQRTFAPCLDRSDFRHDVQWTTSVRAYLRSRPLPGDVKVPYGGPIAVASSDLAIVALPVRR